VEKTPATENLPYSGVKVIVLANLIAGPFIGTLMADYGADVVQVEQPGIGDPLRGLAWKHPKSSDSIWWKIAARGRTSVALDLHDVDAQDAVRGLAAEADVVIDAYRPGVLERWGLGWETLHELNPRLVMCRISGFGQTGPYRERPGFGTLGEAMSGFAAINGWPDLPPTLPPFALGDGVAALTGAFATGMALFERERSGLGQMIDISLVEPLMFLLGPQLAVSHLLGVNQGRTGNSTPFSAPRGAYQCSDGGWIALSGSTPQITRRLFETIGHPEFCEDPRFTTNELRCANAGVLDKAISAWTAQRTADEALKELSANQVAVSAILDAGGILADPHFRERESYVFVDDDELGAVPMPNVIARLSRTPGQIRHTGQPLPEEGDAIPEIRDRWLGTQRVPERSR
jgi:crotonobetainyl-CoA:carnitine CoA-transferase CaiB-like acyl-CoA transferase